MIVSCVCLLLQKKQNSAWKIILISRVLIIGKEIDLLSWREPTYTAEE